MKLIVGLGNPRPEYAATRHNLGWLVIDAIVDKKSLRLDHMTKFGAFVAKDGDVLYVKPAKFYNLTGEVVASIVKFYKIDVETDLLVICDDFNLPFGAVKTRVSGSDGGNNGLKSIAQILGDRFSRIRLGTDNEKRALMGDTDFVLGRFSMEEQAQLPEIIRKANEIVDIFLVGNLKNHKTMVK